MKEKYMNMALELAIKGRGRTSPNPLVGAVIVKNNIVLGKGYHVCAGYAHAEIMALQEAGEKAREGDLYVTLEPCCHYGRTPPCTKAIIEAGIRNVFVAVLDPNPIVNGKGVKILQEAGINVEVGILEKKARKINEVFFKYVLTGMPFMVLKAACSLDGKIATQSGESKWITGEEARAHSHLLRDTYDAIMVGINTILADNPSLNCRLDKGRDPIRIVVDSKLSIPLDARILNIDSTAKTIIATTEQASQEKRKEVAKKAEVITVNKEGKVDLEMLIKILSARKICSVLIEGGACLNNSFIRERLIDKFYIYYAPLIIGGENAPGFSGKLGFAELKSALKLRDLKIEELGKDFLLTGYSE